MTQPDQPDQQLAPRADRIITRLQSRIGELESQLFQAEDVIEQLLTRVADAENAKARAEEALAASRAQ